MLWRLRQRDAIEVPLELIELHTVQLQRLDRTRYPTDDRQNEQIDQLMRPVEY